MAAEACVAPSFITRSSEYRSLYETGGKLAGRYYVLFFRPSAGTCLRAGITVSGKVGGAVVRNRVKRRTKDALRIAVASGAPPADVVFVALRRAAGAPFSGLVSDVKMLLSRVSS